MRIRLWGTEEECRDAAGRLREVFDVVSESEPRADRGISSLVRVYIEVRLSSSTDHCQDSGKHP